MDLSTQLIWLFVLAVPIACISWTVTHEEIFREPREWCVKHSKNDRTLLSRKAFIFLPVNTVLAIMSLLPVYSLQTINFC